MSAEDIKKHQVIGDVIDEFTPSKQLNIQYGDKSVEPYGVELTPTQVKDRPKVSYEAKDDEYYTLVMTDPDAPSREDPKFREWRHWVMINIPGSDVSKGEEVVEYIGAGPPQDTGLHRYVILLFQQPDGKINYTDTRLSNNSADGRPLWKVREFAQKYNLTPVGSAMFQAKFDDYVPKLYEQLSNK